MILFCLLKIFIGSKFHPANGGTIDTTVVLVVSLKIQGNALRIFSLKHRIRQESRQRVVDVQQSEVGASYSPPVRLIYRGHGTNQPNTFCANLPRCHENQRLVT